LDSFIFVLFYKNEMLGTILPYSSIKCCKKHPAGLFTFLNISE